MGLGFRPLKGFLVLYRGFMRLYKGYIRAILYKGIRVSPIGLALFMPRA